ncbi:unnamed protein product [Cylicocyclus nassatus]|uniref:G protein-coupled receptor n=1 Tax=Cylicocyclus nassatus TaxID=53992 RepID=A0AA36GIL5_CYLNA|nr:unnamed protein product [Cylicocyclus nassatus]
MKWLGRKKSSTGGLQHDLEHRDRVITSAFAFGPEDVIRKKFAQDFHHTITNECISGNLSVLDWPILYALMLIVIPFIPVYATILLLRKMIKAITYQAMLPGVFGFCFLANASEASGLLSPSLIGYAGPIIVGLVPIISPMLSLYYIKPYRDWINDTFAESLDSPRNFLSKSHPFTRTSSDLQSDDPAQKFFKFTIVTKRGAKNGFCGDKHSAYVIERTPKQLKIYSAIVGNLAVCDLIACVASLLIVHQRVIPIRMSLFYISYGPCCQLGTAVCNAAYNIWLHCFPHSLYILLVLFSYRYYVLLKPLPKLHTMINITALVYIPSGIQLVMTFLALDMGDDAKKQMSQAVNFDISSDCVSAYLNILEWKTLYILSHMCAPVFPVYIAILILRRKILRQLKSEGTMSEKTIRMHSELLKAITYQSCLPLFLGVGVVALSLGNLISPNHPLLQYLYKIVGLAPILSPLLSLYYIQPYRGWLRQKAPRWNALVSTPRLSTIVTSNANFTASAVP